MNRETAEALEASIKHWEENLELAKTDQLTYDDISGDTCALCHVFVTANNGYCGACPVRTRTGYGSCQGSPWAGVFQAIGGNGDLIVAVEAEIDFLKSLSEEPCN